MKHSNLFRENSGAKAFFFSIMLWGIGVGCFAAALNNFLSDVYAMNSVERGWLEFFRELPGLMLVVLLAFLHRVSDWRIMRIGTLFCMAGVALLLIPANKIFVTAFIMVWSMGEHFLQPVRQVIAMQVAKPEHAGQSLGLLTSVMNFGKVAGSLLVAAIFYAGTILLKTQEKFLFSTVWCLIFILMILSVVSTFTKDAPNVPSKRPMLYFSRKFSKFYALELFYGARKQIFLTFAPYVLIREYGFSTALMAALLGFCAFVNIFAAPMVGRLTDGWGYRNTMIWDTVVLFFVCLMYGFAGNIFPAGIAVIVLCINFLLDAIISTTSLATNLYVKTLAKTQDELTSTLSTGISMNHLISIIVAPLGGWVWVKFGLGTLFSFAAVMAVCNSLFALTLPKPSANRSKAL